MKRLRLMPMVRNWRSQRGISSLVLVLFAVVILSSIIVAIFAMALVLTRQSTRFYTSQSAFFAAEGAMFETIERIRNEAYVWPPGFNSEGDSHSDSYPLGETMIDRTVNYKENDLGVLYYEIIINAYNRGSRRSLEASYMPISPGSSRTTAPNYDIVLALDYSGSMNQTWIDEQPPAIYYLRPAALNFIDAVEEHPGDNRIGLILWNHEIAYSSRNFIGEDYFFDLKNVIRTAAPYGSTDINLAVSSARDMMLGSRTDAETIIIIFSDGIPNYPIVEPRCPDNACVSSFNTSYEPMQNIGDTLFGYGNICTNMAVSESNLAKLAGYDVYTIFLKSYPPLFSVECRNYDSMHLLGQYTLLRMSSEDNESSLNFDQVKANNNEYAYFRSTEEASDLSDIFEGILTQIIAPSGGSVIYHEVDPVNPAP